MKNLLKYKLKYSGLNFNNFINFAIKNEIAINNVVKIDNKNYEFFVLNNGYKKLIKINKIYNISVIKYGGIKYIYNLLLKRIGLLIGAVFVAISALIFEKTTLYINIVGNTGYVNEIKKCINEYGIKTGKINNYNKDELEKFLLNNIPQLSMVSVKTQGNTLLINTYDKQNENEFYEPMIAEYNMLINEITLISGTLNVGKNSIVKKGDILVEAYAIGANGNRIDCEAKAIINADVWFCESETIMKQEVIFEKTGNKKSFSKLSFVHNTKFEFVSPYEYFVTENIRKYISKYNFLPISMNKVTFYETKKKIVNFDFEKNKNKIIEKVKQKAYDNLPKFVTINEENINIAESDDKYIFQVYLKSNMEIK